MYDMYGKNTLLKGAPAATVVKKWNFEFRDPGRGPWEVSGSLWPPQPHVDKFGRDSEVEARPATLERVMRVPLCPRALGRTRVTLGKRLKGQL